MRNALTIDLEDYYHVSAFKDQIATAQWNSQESRIEYTTNLLLDLLDETGCKATFFTLGWVVENRPRVVRQVADRGHEIACHSLRHRTVYEMTPEEFREDTRIAKQLLEDSAGAVVHGYRAPSFSITAKSLWAFEVLAELGFTYDSSIFPIRHPNYGMPHMIRTPFQVLTDAGSITEFPMPTLLLGDMRAPIGGGAYFRFLPYGYTKWAIQFINRHENRQCCVYLHPWELDPQQPRMHGSLTSRIRHYVGLRNTPIKFRKLLRDFEFQPMSVLIEQIKNGDSCSLAPTEFPRFTLAQLMPQTARS